MLDGLREKMDAYGLAAYVVPTDDPHQSEYVADCFNRRSFLSGFTGSAGTCVVTHKEALLWTDGRYFAQAEKQLTASWTLMKDRLPTTVPIDAWLVANLPDGAKVGVDPLVLGYDTGNAWRQKLTAAGMRLVSVEENLVDAVWGDARPSLPLAPVAFHPLCYSGRPVSQKIEMCIQELKSVAADRLVLSALDEVAWMLNIRGSDVTCNPVAISYLTVDKSGAVHWFIHATKVSDELLATVNEEAAPYVVTVQAYDALLKEMRTAVDSGGSRMLLCANSSLAIHDVVPEAQKTTKSSPVAYWKALKNDAELEGMRQAHLRDAVALVNYFVWLEDALLVRKAVVSEAEGAAKLLSFRQQLKDFVGPSFDTISSTGSNGAIIHYKPPEVGSKPIDVDAMYLLDSGGQFKDGTTDVTRTVHLGASTEHQRRCFTRVLQSHIALDTAVFPAGTTGYQLDCIARMPLWKTGLDYRHGTGHGVGAYLNVHEGPQGLSLMRKSCDECGLQVGMTLSNEPGYYEDGAFGIRHENIMIVREADVEHRFGDVQYLAFEHITFMPFQTSMLELALLAPAELLWLNQYHQECRDKVLPLLAGNDAGCKWLLAATEPVVVP